MHSNFAAARLFLERASIALAGEDEFSLRAREALGLLIDGCVRKEFSGSRRAAASKLARSPRGASPKV